METSIRPSTFIDMRVWVRRNLLDRESPEDKGTVRDVLFSAFEDTGGMINERVKVIVELTSGPSSGRFVGVGLNQIRRNWN